MGVYIKGMEMPENGYDCPLCRNGMCRVADYNSDGICLVYGPDEEHRPSDCPLVEVPPHGRLIDADALIEDLERQCKEVFRIDAVSPDDYWITRNEAYNEALWKSWVESFGDYLKTRPTIIEAENGA